MNNLCRVIITVRGLSRSTLNCRRAVISDRTNSVIELSRVSGLQRVFHRPISYASVTSVVRRSSFSFLNVR